MVGFVLAVGAGFAVLYNWASGVYSYNRDAWMTDIQVEQNHVYQRDNLKIAMRGMEREEVRDYIEAYITSINNSVLVATLILAIAGEMLIEGQIPTTCAAFVLNAYMLCLGSAIMHLVLSILFGVFASHAAYDHSTHLLTETIRPNWQKHFEKMDQRRTQREVTQAFENKPICTMLRPPLAARLFGMMTAGYGRPGPNAMDGSTQEPLVQSAAAAADTMDEDGIGALDATGSSRQHSPGGLSTGTYMGRGSASSAMRRTWDDDRRWRTGWKHSEREWFDLRSCMFKCVVLGTRNLLEACGYLCMGNLYSSLDKDAWAFWAVQIIFISLNVIMMVFLIERIKSVKNPADFRFMLIRSIVSCPSGVIAMLAATGPISCIIAAATPWVHVDNYLVPLCYISHCLVTCVLCLVSQEEILGEDDEHKDDDLRPRDEVAHLCSLLCCKKRRRLISMDSQETESTVDPVDFGEALFPASPSSPSEEQSEPAISNYTNYKISGLHTDTAKMPLTMLCWGMVMLCILWFSACIWVIVRMLHGMDLKNNKAIFGETNGPPLVMGNILEHYFINPISPYFQPHYMVCPRQKVFFADTFHVFEKAHDGTVEIYPCRINGTIQDLGAKCNRTACWPLVLLHKTLTVSPAIVDCKSGRLLPLLQTEQEVEFIGMKADDTSDYCAGAAREDCYDGDTLIAASSDKVVQYKWSKDAQGFSPWWVVKYLDSKSEDLVALDLVEESLLVFYRRGVVECQNITSGGFCGRWTLERPVLGGGCAYKENGTSVHVLVDNERHGMLLMSADMPRRGGPAFAVESMGEAVRL